MNQLSLEQRQAYVAKVDRVSAALAELKAETQAEVDAIGDPVMAMAFQILNHEIGRAAATAADFANSPTLRQLAT